MVTRIDDITIREKEADGEDGLRRWLARALPRCPRHPRQCLVPLPYIGLGEGEGEGGDDTVESE